MARPEQLLLVALRRLGARLLLVSAHAPVERLLYSRFLLLQLLLDLQAFEVFLSVERYLGEELGACLMVALLLVRLLFHQVVALFVFVEGDVAILAELSECDQRLAVVRKSDRVVRHSQF